MTVGKNADSGSGQKTFRVRVPTGTQKSPRPLSRGQKTIEQTGFLYAFSTSPALMALTETQTRFVPPLAVLMRMRWRFGRNLRFVMLVTCVPMPPLFLD
jgi:hypothetical protein